MSNIIGINAQGAQEAKKRLVLSYNAENRVLCSLIAQDPFFFDVDPDAIEEEMHAHLLDGARFDVPEVLIKARETSDGFVTLGDDDTGLPLTDDIAELCASALRPAAALNIDNVVTQLRNSQTAATLFAQMDDDGIAFAASADTESAAFDAARKVITINANLDEAAAALVLVRACRQARLAPVKDTLRNPDRAILLNRSLYAELNLIMIQVAWELNLAGDKAAWDLVSTSALADLAYAFGQRASSDFRALRDGRAALAAFDQWFYSGRTRKADRALIQGLLAAGDAGKADNGNVLDAIAAVRSIGERGIGRNYLVEHAMTLLEDGFYGEVRDRSNANFLWFVKFERSYRAAEEHVEMQNRVEASTAMEGIVLHFPAMKKARKARKAQAVAAIVPLEAMRP